MQDQGQKKRVPELDILKGITIALVVIGHTRVPGNSFIYLFHMAVFFIASGVFYSGRASRTVQTAWHFTVKKIRALWLPFALGISLFTLLNNIFVRIGVLTDNTDIYQYVEAPYASVHPMLSAGEMLKNILKTFAFSGSAQLAGTFWFFKTLFLVSVLYCWLEWMLRHLFRWPEEQTKQMLALQCAISLLFLLCGYLLAARGIGLGGLTRTLLVYCLYFGGSLFRKLQSISLRVAGVMGIIGLLVLLFCGRFGTIALDRMEIVNPLFYLLCSFAGMFFLYGASRCLHHFFPRMGVVVGYMGRHSMAIMIGHFLSFKLISYGIVAANRMPIFCAAAFPVLLDTGLWWIAYGAAGIALPLLVQKIWKKSAARFWR